MSKKSKTNHAKLIATPAAGKADDNAENIKLVIGLLMNNGYKVEVAHSKPKEKSPLSKKRG